jgi:hypothetical protein
LHKHAEYGLPRKICRFVLVCSGQNKKSEFKPCVIHFMIDKCGEVNVSKGHGPLLSL